MNDQIIWQRYIQQIESLSPESKVSKFCKEAGFIRVVEVGQYFVTKDTGCLRQFRSVACREYTLPRDDPTSEAKGWIQGNTRIGLVLEVTTSFQHFKYGIEIRIKSVNQDDSHSWVRNVLIGTGILAYIYHVGCTLPGGQNLSRRQTVFFLPVDPRDESHKDPEYIDFSVPRLARYLHSAWKRHQDAVFRVDIDLAIKEGLTFCQTRSNANILQRTFLAYCILKVVRLKNWRSLV